MKQRSKWLKAMSIALSCAVLATTAPMNVLATEVSAVAEVQSVTVPVVLDLESKILSYDTYGTWKENVPLSIEVNGVRTELKKDGSSVNVDFKNGDTVKLIVSDNIELYKGTVSVVDSSVSVVAEKDYFGRMMKYNINYDSILNNLVISGKYWSSGGISTGRGLSSRFSYDLTAITNEGTPIQGITLTDNTTALNLSFDYWEFPKHKEWGNGNSFSYELVTDEDGENEPVNTIFIKATDENGYTDATMPNAFGDMVNMGGSIVYSLSTGGDICSEGKVYLNNGLVDIDTEAVTSYGEPYYATLETLGNVSLTNTPYSDENGILGDYYEVRTFGVAAYCIPKETLILKDEDGKEIATVEISNLNIKGNIDDTHYLKGSNDAVLDLLSYDTNIQMADGMDNWNVTVDFSNDTFNIKAVKTVSTDDDNTQDDTIQPDDTNKPEDDTNTSDTSYEVTLPADKTTISKSDFAAVLEANKTKDVVIKSNNNITFTFAKGTMANVDGMENYDFGSSVVSDFANAGNMGSSVTKDNFVTRINYNYSGKLPAKAEIKIYVGTDYANQTLYYSKIVEDGFKLIQSVKVDKDGYITITQDSCSDYVVTTNDLTVTTPEDTQKPEDTTKPEDSNKPEDTTMPDDNKTDDTEPSAPKTGDNMSLFMTALTFVSGMGLVVFGLKKRNFVK